MNEDDDSVVDVLAGYRNAFTILRKAGDACYEQSQIQDKSTLEKLKSHKELLESIMELFSRCEKTLATLKIEQLSTRIGQFEEKLQQLQQRQAVDEKDVLKIQKQLEQVSLMTQSKADLCGYPLTHCHSFD